MAQSNESPIKNVPGPAPAAPLRLQSPGARTTVLPQLAPGPPPQLVIEPRARYAATRPLGEGGMGEVLLVEDQDIHRPAAMKRLKDGAMDLDSIGRFVDEIQIVGQLEHPSIVPIHDVGVDERGRPFFIMKYLEGETLEAIIEKLAVGAPEYVARFTYEFRARIFMQVLEAVHFAHERGYIHRDLKPGNIMVGRFGEVMVMDWGLAKRISPEGPPAPPQDDPVPPEVLASVAGADDAKATIADVASQTMRAASDGPDHRGASRSAIGSQAASRTAKRMSTTRLGVLVGTPAYMAPEQVRGENDSLDARCDTYSLSALFYEFLTLEHYLPPKTSISALLFAVLHEDPPGALALHHRFNIPPEMAWFVRPGLEKNPARRYQSAADMIAALQRVLEGQISPQCPCTTIKRAGHEFSDFINNYPYTAITTIILTTLLVAYGATRLVIDLLGGLHLLGGR